MTVDSSSRLAPVQFRPKLADEVKDKLRQALLSGRFQRGDRLRLEELAAELGVSIMPVREALIALSNEGLVEAEPRRGFRATPLEQQDLDDIFEVHAKLAGILAARAAAQATDEDIARLRSMHAEFEVLAAGPQSDAASHELGTLNSEFHRAINRIPSGERVRGFIRLTYRYVRSDLFESVPGMISSALSDHPGIVDAIAAHDTEHARTLTEEHLLKGSHLWGCVLAPPVG